MIAALASVGYNTFHTRLGCRALDYAWKNGKKKKLCKEIVKFFELFSLKDDIRVVNDMG